MLGMWQKEKSIVDGTSGRRRQRKLAMAGLASVLLSLVIVPLTGASAQAATPTCKQHSVVWVGGLDHNGIISSDNPGGTIHVPFGHGVFLTGIVQPNTSITFHVTVDGAAGQLDIKTGNANGNCVVNQTNFGPLPFIFDPEVERWSATYTPWENGGQQDVTTNLGTIDVS